MFKEWSFGETKVIEVQAMTMLHVCGFGLLVTHRKGDHWGWEVELYLPLLWAHVQIYDIRHMEEV